MFNSAVIFQNIRDYNTGYSCISVKNVSGIVDNRLKTIYSFCNLSKNNICSVKFFMVIHSGLVNSCVQGNVVKESCFKI